MRIRNAEDLASLYGEEPGPDLWERIKSRVYKTTSCGAWIAPDTSTGKKIRSSWFVEVSGSIPGRVLIHRVRRAGSKEWIAPEKAPIILQEWLFMEWEGGHPVMGKDIPNLGVLRQLQEAGAEKEDVPWWIRKDQGSILQVEVRRLQIPGPERQGIACGSIIEGVERTTCTQYLHFPFSESLYRKMLAVVEMEADQIWNETHGCEKCGPEDPDTGYRPVNPECEECKGEGIIL